MSKISYKDHFLQLAARVGQIKEEIRPAWTDPTTSLSSSHECGVAMSICNSLESKLIKLSGRFE